MRQRWVLVGIAAMFLVPAGCAQKQTDFTPLAVRFVLPPVPERFADLTPDGDTRAVTSTYDDTYVETVADNDMVDRGESLHVALWGGQYHGNDVTFAGVPLDPGHYTFGCWDQDDETTFKGWVRVNTGGTELIDTLREWKADIPKQKHWLAYDFELKGKLYNTDAAVFRRFANQLRAFDRLERQMDEAIAHEEQMQAEMNRRHNDFLAHTEILVLPGDEGWFYPTTMPTFTDDDVRLVKSGNSMTKLLTMADFEMAQWKLRMVNRLTNELRGCRAAMAEEIDRLERRKRFYTITDHIYQHDRKFVENEMRIQQALGTIDRLNEQIDDMRSRRMALAFATELVAPDKMFRPLDDERRDLEQERAVLEAKRKRLNTLVGEASETGPRRIALERERQRIIRNIESIDHQFEVLAEARDVLDHMKNTTFVIHRQGDSRLIAATFVEPDAPFRIRDAIERECLMTVRLQSTDTPYDPNNPQGTRVRTTSWQDPTGSPRLQAGRVTPVRY